MFFVALDYRAYHNTGCVDVAVSQLLADGQQSMVGNHCNSHKENWLHYFLCHKQLQKIMLAHIQSHDTMHGHMTHTNNCTTPSALPLLSCNNRSKQNITDPPPKK